MECNVIKDLLPLYVDACCSDESAELVSAHLKSCPKCQEEFVCNGKSCSTEKVNPAPPIKLRRVSDWKASVLQSAMFFLSFAIVVLGVILEGATPAGSENGLWAVALIVPATANLLSLVNWYFIRLYRSRKAFSNGSCMITFAVTAGVYIWAFLHYTEGIEMASPQVILGAVLSLVFIVLSKLLSHQYAAFLGRE